MGSASNPWSGFVKGKAGHFYGLTPLTVHARPDEEVIQEEQGRLLGEFKVGFEKTLGKRELVEVFRRVWAGEKRREIAEKLGMGVGRIKALQRGLNRRLAKYAARARGGVAEMLGSFKKW